MAGKRARTMRADVYHGSMALALGLLGAVGLIAVLVWHATKLNRVDAWAYRWQAVAHQHGGLVAEVVSGTEAPVVLLTMLACALVAWRAGRLVTGGRVKGRQWGGSPRCALRAPVSRRRRR